MSFRNLQKQIGSGLLVLITSLSLLTPAAASAAERKVKQKVAPSYPELAKKMSVTGSVKVQAVVTPSGVVKTVKVVGGHPLLVDAAVDAVKKWKYEVGPDETTELVEFKFNAGEQ